MCIVISMLTKRENMSELPIANKAVVLQSQRARQAKSW